HYAPPGPKCLLLASAQLPGAGRARLVQRRLRRSPTLFSACSTNDRQIAALDIANFVQSLSERIGHILCLTRRPGAEITNRRSPQLLCACRGGPRYCRTTNR